MLIRLFCLCVCVEKSVQEALLYTNCDPCWFEYHWLFGLTPLLTNNN